jgi:hypothetical protein
MSFLSQDGKQSSMRAAFLIIAGACSLILLSVMTVVLSSLWRGEQIDYMGLAALVGALSAPLTGLGVSKAHQKKHELKLDEYE